MTDLPQHEAIVSIMRHMHDPAFGFERYYDWALDRTLYVLPYLLALCLSYIVPIRLAVHITIFLATVSYPLGVLMTLRALKRPQVLTLLALPLLYNRSFFWGFIHFNLGIGIAFVALSQLVGPWSRRKGWIVAGLCLLTAVTHVYGLVLLFSYAAAWLLVGDRRALISRAIWMVPAAVAFGAWGLYAANAPGYGTVEWAPFDVRLKELGNSILGGYVDHSEDVLLWGLLLVVSLLAFRSFPVTWGRWKKLGVHNRVAYVLVATHLIAYFVLPIATPTAKFIHFRHAVIAAMVLPFIISGTAFNRNSNVARILPAFVAVFALVNTWWHLFRFEGEARQFDVILAAIPERAKLAQLTYESKGMIMRSHAYLHFGAYAQAQKGGVFAVSFPMLFWNIPLKGRANSDMPETPKNLEWSPGRFSESRMGYFYDTVLVRLNSRRAYKSGMYNPYHLVAAAGSWQLYGRNQLQSRPGP